MLGKLKLRKRRANLRRALGDDLLQPPPDTWLDGAASVAELHAHCTEPGWLVHCAYWHGTSQDALLDGALCVAGRALHDGPPNVFPLASLEGLRDRPWPAIAELVVALESRYPSVQAITELVPTQLNYAMAALGDARIAAGREPAPPAEAHPYRSADQPLLADESVDTLAAVGYVLTLHGLFHRHEGLREALTYACAGAAAAFVAAAPPLRDAMLSELRSAYGWNS